MNRPLEQQRLDVTLLPEAIDGVRARERKKRLQTLFGFASMTLACLVSLLLIELVCRFWLVYSDFPESNALKAFQRKYEIASLKNQSNLPNIVLLGDSQMDFAVYPELLQRMLEQGHAPHRVINLASPSVTPALSLALLKKVTESDSGPKTVIMNVNTRHFDAVTLADPSQTVESNLYHSYLGQCLIKKPKDPLEKFQCSLSKQFYLVRYRSKLKDILMKADKIILNPDKLHANSKIDIYPAREVSPLGWAPGYGVPINQKQFMESGNKNNKRSKRSAAYQWTGGPMQEIMTYCKQHEIPVVLVSLPLHPSYQLKLPVQAPLFAKRVAFFSLKNKAVFLNWENLYPDYPPYLDGDHLNVIGSIDLTQKLGRYILSNKLSSKNKLNGSVKPGFIEGAAL